MTTDFADRPFPVTDCDCDTCFREEQERAEVENADIRSQWRRDVAFGVDPQGADRSTRKGGAL